jgi:hypothetical protein
VVRLFGGCNNTVFVHDLTSRPGHDTEFYPLFCMSENLVSYPQGRTQIENFENSVLGRTYGPKSDEVTGDWRKLHSAKVYNLYSSANIIRAIVSKGDMSGSGFKRHVSLLLLMWYLCVIINVCSETSDPQLDAPKFSSKLTTLAQNVLKYQVTIFHHIGRHSIANSVRGPHKHHRLPHAARGPCNDNS